MTSKLYASALASLAEDMPGAYRRLKNLRDMSPVYSMVVQPGKIRRNQELVNKYLGGRFVVQDGPFAGMCYVQDADHLVPHLLGSYESEIHDWVEDAIDRGYERVVNIGCAEGYYSVGMAMRCPEILVHSFDLSIRAQRQTVSMAMRNKVADRVTVGGRCSSQHLATLTGPQTLVICDIEGAEKFLLDPARTPQLLETDMIIETHDHMRPETAATLKARFAESHTIEEMTVELVKDETLKALKEVGVDTQLLNERRSPDQTWLRLTVK